MRERGDDHGRRKNERGAIGDATIWEAQRKRACHAPKHSDGPVHVNAELVRFYVLQYLKSARGRSDMAVFTDICLHSSSPLKIIMWSFGPSHRSLG